jgi:uncharacterized membrane protein
MTALYFAVVTVHVLAALLWLGGMFFLAAVGAPVLRAVEPPELRASLFRTLGERFRAVGWISIAVLVATGVTILGLRGLLHTEVLLDREFWTTGFGMALAWKVSAVLVIIGLSLVHDFFVGPAASRAVPGSAEAGILRRRAAWLARMAALVGLVLVVAAVRLARGG